MSTATKRMPHTAAAPDRSPSGQSSSDKQQLRKRLLEMIVKREAERRAPPRATG